MEHLLLSIFICFFLVFSVLGGQLSGNARVVILNDTTFEENTSSEMWIVEFYAPW